MKQPAIRIYKPEECAVFSKIKDEFGGYSLMASGYPVKVNDVEIDRLEVLYQACRFPENIEVQAKIIAEKNPMAAKMKTKPYRQGFNRPDWDNGVNVMIMRWCLRVKLLQNWEKFSALLMSSGTKPIVELSRKDDFWGAKKQKNGTLKGRNVLGRLLTELREAIYKNEDKATNNFQSLAPLKIPNFLLMGKQIETIIRK